MYWKTLFYANSCSRSIASICGGLYFESSYMLLILLILKKIFPLLIFTKRTFCLLFRVMSHHHPMWLWISSVDPKFSCNSVRASYSHSILDTYSKRFKQFGFLFLICSRILEYSWRDVSLKISVFVFEFSFLFCLNDFILSHVVSLRYQETRILLFVKQTSANGSYLCEHF
jgi:hypothetical protein